MNEFVSLLHSGIAALEVPKRCTGKPRLDVEFQCDGSVHGHMGNPRMLVLNADAIYIRSIQIASGEVSNEK